MDCIGLWPVGSPSEITLMQCYGYMQTGVLRVLCIFFDHGIPYAYPKGFRKVHVQTTYGSLWISFGLGNTGMDQARVRFGQNSRPKGRNFALNWAQGEVGVSLNKMFFFFFFFRIFIKSFHKQAVMVI